MMSGRMDEHALDTLFLGACSVRAKEHPIPGELLRRLYELVHLGPTAANCQPTRIVFATSPAAKEKLLPLMDAGNAEPTRAAPVTALVGYDLRFYEQLPRLFAHQPDAVSWFSATPGVAREAALLNGSLQGGYLIMAARALGLDCGPMGGFDAEAAARTFFPGRHAEVNFMCNLDYRVPGGNFPRLPRLDFEEACVIA